MSELGIWDGAALVGHELALFAAVGFVIFGLDDLLVDLIWIGRTLWRRITVFRHHERGFVGALPPPALPSAMAIFIPAWDESAVIGAMLRHALASWAPDDFLIFVGCYPNDADTAAAVKAVDDPRVRLVSSHRPGPTTKADCLNCIWRDMLEVERHSGQRFKAVVLHDAEDVVHPAELGTFASLIERAALVQLPVLPLIDRGSRWIAGHYADEFAESHAKELVVREAIGASLPSAGVGCAIARDVLGRLANDVGPFDPTSLTEDYEIGLRLHALGVRSMFVRLPGARGRKMVSTREHFPAALQDAVRQKARWVSGIALAGWDRLGWRGGVAERWMRLRDRRSPLAALILLAAYASLVLFGLLSVQRWLGGDVAITPGPALGFLLAVNFGLLVWRMAMRFGFVTMAYGPMEGLRSLPRMVVANIVAMLAARLALANYLRSLTTGEMRWEKTRHIFPDAVPAE